MGTILPTGRIHSTNVGANIHHPMEKLRSVEYAMRIKYVPLRENLLDIRRVR